MSSSICAPRPNARATTRRRQRRNAMAGYGPELAAAHHDGYGDVARAAAAVLRRELRDGANGLVVDLGCGTGILARVMTDAGFDVLGVDLSADMIAIAQEHAPAARFVVSSFVDVDLPPCR